MSQITTHVLDTSLGKPGRNIKISLQEKKAESWTTIAEGKTNNDGRIADLLKEGETLSSGIYKLIFQTGDYFGHLRINTFYPFVEITFETSNQDHYHVPLLINPFGYSTYRGS